MTATPAPRDPSGTSGAPAHAEYVAVGIEDGRVVLRWPAPACWIALDPQNCLDLAEAMATAAFECRDGVKPVGPALAAELVERHRLTLTRRFTLMLGRLRADATRSDAALARTLVDAALKEIF